VWAQAIAAHPALQEFYGPRHDAIAAEFCTLEAKRRSTTSQIICGRHAEKMPRGNYGAMNVIRSQVQLKRGHMPIRKLFKAAGETLQRIKPVLLMSPISVAQFLPPGSVEFDLLVIDEASQVRPEDALGLVARARQIVVVGDNKQLPPTSFFDRIIADEEEQDDADEETNAALGGASKATDLESILALCEARGLNSAMLRWHYRSRHPSLIEVSNAEFYKHLIMPPAPSAERSTEGLILTRVAGAYDRGGKRINMIEAEAIADAVSRHAKMSPHLSLGIVTFSTPQRDAIGDILDFKRRTDEVLDAFLREGKAEDVFIKNLENVQGDERDVILISVGYGPRVAGARLDSMAFGPVSAEGGERRLNVLFTRARSRCEIFASFAAGDIDPDRAGVKERVFSNAFCNTQRRAFSKKGSRRRRTPIHRSRKWSHRSWRGLATRSTSRSGPPGSRLTLPSATRSSPAVTCSPLNVTARPIIGRSGRANATGCGRKYLKTWAGASTAFGRPIGSTGAERRSRN
jgi:hypothetical protein